MNIVTQLAPIGVLASLVFSVLVVGEKQFQPDQTLYLRFNPVYRIDPAATQTKIGLSAVAENIPSQKSAIDILYIQSSPTPTSTPTPIPTPTSTPTPTPVLVRYNYISSELDSWFNEYGSAYSVDPQILKSIAYCESKFNPAAVNGPYAGLFQYTVSSWISTRNQMNEDSDPDLRFNPAQAIRTSAFKISRGGIGAWPHCGKQ